MGEERIGGHLLVEALKAQGVEIAFGVPGESYLAVIDGLHDANSVKTVMCRQEGGAAMMAEAHGKITGRPGLCMVTRGPGATNASAGVHIAFQDSTPMVLLVGQVARDQAAREAFQEIDYRRMYGQMAKWVAEIDIADRIPEYISRAFHTAMAGRPGPVVLALPEDMLRDATTTAAADIAHVVEAHPGAEDMARLRAMLAAAERPLAIVGGGAWDAQTSADFQAFAEANGLPVGTSFRCQDYFDNRHPNYVGHVGIGVSPTLGGMVRDADLLLVVGARMGEMTTSGYELLDIPSPRQKLVHVHPGAEELGRVYRPELAILASPRSFARAARTLAPVDGAAWAERLATGRAAFEAGLTPQAGPGDVQMGEIVRWLDGYLPEDAFICNGAGNYATWVHRYFRYKGYRTQLAPTSGSMGYGVPAAVAAKIACPDRMSVAFSGDGCFMMHGQELATAMQYGAPTINVVVDNGMFGTIRMHQEKHYPGRTHATELRNPDFAALGRAYGGFGATVERTDQFADAFREAEASGLPAILHVKIDPEAITPTASISDLRAQHAG